MVTKAIILCGGLNTRFMPETKSVPKEMLPLHNRPIVQVLIEQLAKAGIDEVLLILSKEKMCIYNHFFPNKTINKILKERNKTEQINELNNLSNIAKVSFIIQPKPMGTMHAISLTKKWTKNQPFIVLNGDEVLINNDCSAGQLAKAYETHKCTLVGIKKVNKDQVNRYGMIDVKSKSKDFIEICGMVEKPAIGTEPSLFANIGCYLFTPDIYDYIDLSLLSKGEAYITTSIHNMCVDGKKVGAIKINGTRYDLGDPHNYTINNFDYSLRNSDNPQLYIDYIKRIAKEFNIKLK